MNAQTTISQEERLTKMLNEIDEQVGATYCKLRYSNLRHLNGDGTAAALLSHVMNILRLQGSTVKGQRELLKNNLWLPVPAKETEAETGMKPDRQHRAFQTLKTAGMINLRHWHQKQLQIKIRWKTLKKIRLDDTKKVRSLIDFRNGESLDLNGNQKRGKPVSRNGESLDLNGPSIVYCIKNVNKRGDADASPPPLPSTNGNGHHPRPGTKGTPPLNGRKKKRDNSIPAPPDRTDPFIPKQCWEDAKMLRQTVRANGEVPDSNTTEKTCARNLAEMMQGGIDYRPSLLAYVESYPDRISLGLPTCTCAAHFRKHFTWIKDKASRRAQKTVVIEGRIYVRTGRWHFEEEILERKGKEYIRGDSFCPIVGLSKE